MEEKRCLTDEHNEKEHAEAPPAYNVQAAIPPPGYYDNQAQSAQPYVMIQGGQQVPSGYPVYTQQPQMVAPGTIIVASSEPPPPDHLGYAIFVTICCCWPLGIIAILRASDSRAAASRGDIQTARVKSREAKQMAHIALGIGITVMVLSVLFSIVYIFMLMQSLRLH